MLAGVLGIAAGLGLRAWKKGRPTVAELERRRRLDVSVRGKIGDAMLIEVEGDSLVFNYQIGGMEYTAAQDVSALAVVLPEDRWRLVGPVSIKYEVRNPANSIVVSEEWSGLRKR